MNDNDDMPPELEDLSEDLNKIRKSRGQLENQESEIKVNVVNNKININTSTTKSIEKNNANEEQEFGSFLKKGFFKRNQNTNSNNTQNNNKAVDLTHIKSTTDKSSVNKVFEEIKSEIKTNRENTSDQSQKTLLNNIVDKKEEWMNQDLLMKIAQKPNLMKYFMDPKFTEIILLMQKDPQKAIAQYGHVQEFSEFIKEFSGIMADHFGKLGQHNKKENPQFDQETQEILNDPQIQPIIYKLQTEGKLDVEEIQKDPKLASKIKKLIDKGVFRVQKESELNK